jgi:hypothetical protein
MKAVTILFFLTISASTFSQVETFRAREVTCREIQESLAREGQVNITINYLFGPQDIAVFQDIKRCRAGYRKASMIKKTSDLRKCYIGKYCRQDHDF